MKNSNENGQSRGEMRLENSEKISNVVLENPKEQSGGIPTYTVENSELDDMLNEATTTKAESEQQAKAEQHQEQQEKAKQVSDDEAARIAVTGLSAVLGLVKEFTGKEIALGETPVALFAALTSPLIQKYKPKLSISTDGVDLDSWMPELMALGGVTAVAVPAYFQVNSEVVDNGDKS